MNTTQHPIMPSARCMERIVAWVRHFRQSWTWSRMGWRWISGRTDRNPVSFIHSRVAAARLHHVDPSNTLCKFITTAQFRVYQPLIVCFRFAFFSAASSWRKVAVYPGILSNIYILTLFDTFKYTLKVIYICFYSLMRKRES